MTGTENRRQARSNDGNCRGWRCSTIAIGLAAALAAGLAAGLAVGPAVAIQRPAGSSDQVEPFGRTEQITALDVVVELAYGPNNEAVGPRDLAAGDFQILVAGEPQQIVAVEAAPRRRQREIEPWRIVLYFDFDLAGGSSVRWAAAKLGEVVADLVALGPIEIIVADSDPSVRLTPTREAALVADALFELESSPMGPSAIERVRTEFLDEVHAGEPRWTPDELATAALAEEEAIVHRQLNAMSLALVERDTAGSRRAVVFITDGFDLRPGRFYEGWRGESLPAAIPSEDRSRLSTLTEETGRILAAYGWITLPLVGPDRDPGLVYGLRIGKWRLAGPAPLEFFGVRLERESQREPERAEALIELGNSLLAQGRSEEAEAALRGALFHFAGDPRTAKRQAQASALLGQSLESQGREDEAVEAFAVAVALDSTLATRYPGAEAVIGEPLLGLEEFARATSGAVARGREQLSQALAGLGRRVRLTYQLTGQADGELRPTEVQYLRSGLIVRAPAWTRSGTPASVAAARVRSLLDGVPIEGDVVIEATADRWVEASDRSVEVAVEVPASMTALERSGSDVEAGRSLRVTIGVGLPDRPATIWHDVILATGGESGAPTIYRRRIESPGEELWVAALVEDLGTGSWGCDVVEIGSR